MNEIPFSVVFLAGGMGMRMGGKTPKQYLALNGKPLALHSFEVFASLPDVQQVIVVCEPAYEPLFTPYQDRKPFLFARPGPLRQDSLFNGIQLLEGDPLVCVHDSARPFIEASLVRKVIRGAEEWGAAAVGVRVKSTIKICDEDQLIVKTIDRAALWEMQTPQAVRLSLLKAGFAKAQKERLTVTDDVALAELMGKPAKVVEGSYHNIKVTTPDDLLVAQNILEKICIATN